MKLNRKWSMDHTKGLLLGIVTPIVVMPLVILFLSWMQDYLFEQLWTKFSFNVHYRTKILTISIIANLIWFYMFLNKSKYNVARGVIIGTLLFAPYILYIKFF